jgi:hypothetical protein
MEPAMPLPIPESIDEITPLWLTEALRSTGTIKQAAVTSLTREPIGAGVGLLGELARLTPVYDRAEGGAPATLIAKLPTREPGGRGLAMMLGFYEVEMRYYREMAALNPLRSPACYYAAGDPATIRFVLLLEDLASLRLGDQLQGLTVDEARLAIRQFARYHARFWDTPAGPQLDWIPGFDHPRFMALVASYPGAKDGLLARVGERLSTADRDLIEGFGSQFMPIIEGSVCERMTIAHGDARMDNLFFGSTDGSSPMTVIDWQILARAPGTYDIGYMLSQSIDSNLRRAHEESLLRGYHAALVEGGVDCYSWEQCWADYRRVVLYALVYPVFAGGSIEPANERGMELIRALTDRSLAAIRDLRCVELLG